MSQDDLSDDDDNENNEEHEVAAESLEDVDLVTDLAGREHVEDLHQHEHREDKSHVSRRAIFSVDDVKRLSAAGICASREHKLAVTAVAPLLYWLEDEVLTCEKTNKQA